MVQHFIDLTLPAHDPNFPKPRGLLAVPPEVAEWVADEEARFAREVRWSRCLRRCGSGCWMIGRSITTTMTHSSPTGGRLKVSRSWRWAGKRSTNIWRTIHSRHVGTSGSESV